MVEKSRKCWKKMSKILNEIFVILRWRETSWWRCCFFYTKNWSLTSVRYKIVFEWTSYGNLCRFSRWNSSRYLTREWKKSKVESQESLSASYKMLSSFFSFFVWDFCLLFTFHLARWESWEWIFIHAWVFRFSFFGPTSSFGVYQEGSNILIIFHSIVQSTCRVTEETLEKKKRRFSFLCISFFTWSTKKTSDGTRQSWPSDRMESKRNEMKWNVWNGIDKALGRLHVWCV